MEIWTLFIPTLHCLQASHHAYQALLWNHEIGTSHGNLIHSQLFVFSNPLDCGWQNRNLKTISEELNLHQISWPAKKLNSQTTVFQRWQNQIQIRIERIGFASNFTSWMLRNFVKASFWTRETTENEFWRLPSYFRRLLSLVMSHFTSSSIKKTFMKLFHESGYPSTTFCWFFFLSFLFSSA